MPGLLVAGMGVPFLFDGMIAPGCTCIEAACGGALLHRCVEHDAGAYDAGAGRMADVQSQLDPRTFLRVHRSYIVNPDAIARIEPSGKAGGCAVLGSGVRVPIRRSGEPKIRNLMR